MNDTTKKEAGPVLPEGDLATPQGPHTPSLAPEIAERREEIVSSTQAVSEETPRTERLALLREAHEVVEDDSDVIDIFMYARSDMPLTRKEFLKDFPKGKALVITQEQMEKIEALSDNFFSYIDSSGKRKYVNSEEMAGPLVLFLAYLGV